jgi:hypothetical protein
MAQGSRRVVGRIGAVSVIGWLGLAGGAAGTASSAECAGFANEIVCENARPGSPPGEWEVRDWSGQSIHGFASPLGVAAGGTVEFRVKTLASRYRLDIYRLGWYRGLGARHVATVRPAVPLPQTQPACRRQAATQLVDCGNWAVSARWAVPADAVSGVYVARAAREDGAASANHIVFVVRDDDGRSDILFQTSDATWQAYNEYGGPSLYRGTSPTGRAYKVSYNRPIVTRGGGFGQREHPFYAEYPMLRWLERNGYDVSYTTGVDVARAGAELREHRVFLSVGHDEYVSREQRTAVTAARDAGVSLGYFSGNAMYWKTRWEPSIDGRRTPFRTLVCYKEGAQQLDPSPVWTGLWRDGRHSPPADGGQPENALKGTMWGVVGASLAIRVPAEDGGMRLWRNTAVARLAPGATATLARGTLGYEWDTDQDNGARPAGLFGASTTTVNGVRHHVGLAVVTGPATQRIMLHRVASGALVFDAATIQWSWGLDPAHDFPALASPTADVRMQQATLNVLADMRVQPATRQANLVAATPSSDTAPAAARITAPVNGARIARGTQVTIRGTAADAGGRVGAVEASVDGGRTWHAAAGRGSWTFAWRPTASGSYTIRARAVDDSGNLQRAPAQVSVVVS